MILFSLLCPWFVIFAPGLWNRAWCPNVLRRLTDQRRRTDEWEVSRRSGWAESEATTLSAHQVVWPCYTLLHLVTLCHALSYLVTPCHTLSHLFIPCHTLSYLVTSFHTMSILSYLVKAPVSTREQLIVPCWLSQHTYWQIKIKPAFHKSKSNWRCH